MIAGRREQVFEIYNKEESELLRLLGSFGIKVSSISLVKERFFNHYNIKLSPGTRISKIERLLPDIGMHLGSRSAPLGSVLMQEGIYRLSVQTAPVESPPITELASQLCGDHYLSVALGVKANGEPLIRDLSKIPNLIIAGTTGSGKSVLLHSVIISAIVSGAKVYISDPKMVEFDRYRGAQGVESVSSSYDEACEVIESLTEIMNKRFAILKKKGSRSAQDLFLKTGSKLVMEPICLVIDEWADLVLQNKDIQKKLCILAQKGRAAGISVILSTQRPSSSVISGLIKANFPGRVGLRVASLIDSRVILDQSGAEKISDVGMGLFLDGKSGEPILFRAPNIVDIDYVMTSLNLRKSIKKTIWGRLGWL